MTVQDPKKLSITAITIIVLFHSLPLVQAQDFTPIELQFTVYSDGYVGVDYNVDVDPTKARIDIPLFGSDYQYLLIEDQDGLPLDSSPIQDGLRIDSLGSISMLISYVTPDLTSKVGPIWYLMVETTVNCSIVLPEEAVYAPTGEELSISSIDGGILIEMSAGNIEVSYSIEVTDPRAEALAMIEAAEETIDLIKTKGIITIEADNLIQEAYSALNSGEYSKVEQMAQQAVLAAQNAEDAALSAQSAIDASTSSISVALNAGRTVGLDQAEDLLHQAKNAYSNGEYTNAKSLAEEANAAAAAATKEEPEPEPKRNNVIWFAVSGLVVLAGLGATYFFLWRKKPITKVELTARIDLEAIFDENPYLRLDDKEVIRFIVEAGGSAFAAEIRDRFDVPRTSLWRMLRRLEREGITDMQNIGGQSLVKISEKYTRQGE